jgi:hypothetical protein
MKLHIQVPPPLHAWRLAGIPDFVGESLTQKLGSYETLSSMTTMKLADGSAVLKYRQSFSSPAKVISESLGMVSPLHLVLPWR